MDCNNFFATYCNQLKTGTIIKENNPKLTYYSKYVLIDLWAPLEHYGGEVGSFSASKQSGLYEEAKKALKPWSKKTRFVQGRSDTVVLNYASGFFDFVYIDARHDYCAVKKDIKLWWTKIRPGGILAGY